MQTVSELHPQVLPRISVSASFLAAATQRFQLPASSFQMRSLKPQREVFYYESLTRAIHLFNSHSMDRHLDYFKLLAFISNAMTVFLA